MYNCITECQTEEGLKLDQCRTEEGFDCPTSRGSASRSSLNRRLQGPKIEKRKKLLLENRKKSINEEVIDQVVRGGSISGERFEQQRTWFIGVSRWNSDRRW